MELQLENITKNYRDKKVLKGISLTMGTGVYGLLGPNGAGKTTMNAEQLINYQNHAVISNVRAKGGCMEVRIIEEAQPVSGAVQAVPALEDAYLYLFNYLPEKPGR